MQEITTTDLSQFGWREWSLARDILDSMMKDGLPEDFENDGVTLMFNKQSGNVFLTNADYQTAMISYHTEKLDTWYFTPYEGREGFFQDLIEEYEDMHPEDQEYLRDIAEARGEELKTKGE